jgi:hypothetical protein
MRKNRLNPMVRKTQLGIAAAGLLLWQAALSPASAMAAWSNKPAWANNPGTANAESAAPRRPAPAYRESRNRISPFAPESNNVSLAVGQVFLMGDLANYSDAIGAEVQYTYGVSEMFGFQSSLGYSSHSDGKYSMGTLLTGVRANLSWYDKVIPYAVVGLGFYKPRMQFEDLSSVSPLLFGLHLGPGIDLQLTRDLFFGAGLTFHDIFGNDEKLANGRVQSVGGTYTTFLIHAGISF